MHPIDRFQHDITARGHSLNDVEWQAIEEQLAVIQVGRGDVLIDSSIVAETVVFVCDGVAASLQNSADGDQQIARFFERNQFCTNITSAWHQTISDDELIAMTDLTGISVPFGMFRQEFMSSGPLAMYWREKVFETLLFDKDLMCAKTMRDVGSRYRFLMEQHSDVVGSVPDKYIARFLGITPQGLSRFLKNKCRELT